MPREANAAIAGVQSPPLRDAAQPMGHGLRKWAPRFRRGSFSRRDALRASAWQGPTNAEAFPFHPTMRQEARWPTGRMPRSSRCLPIRACGARPSLGQARQRSPSWKGPGEDKRGGSLGPGSGVLHLCRLHAISFLKVASAHLAFSEIDTILTIPVRFA